MTNREVKRKLIKYIKTAYIDEPNCYINKSVYMNKKLEHLFVIASFQKWAAKDMLSVLKLSDNVYEDLEKIINRYNEFSTININGSYIFSIAYDMAMDVLDHYISLTEGITQIRGVAI